MELTPEEQLVADFYSHLREEGSVIKVSTQGSIRVDEELIKPNQALQWVQSRVKDREELRPLLLMEVPKMLAMFRVAHARFMRNTPQYDDVRLQHYDYEGLIPFQSVTDAKRFALFDTKTNSVMDLDYATFKESMGTRVEAIRGRIEFNPYFPQPISFRPDQYGRPCNFLNTYKKPEWQDSVTLDSSEIKNMKPNPLIIEFLTHLFPDSDSFRYVLDWLHFALTDRCEVYLVLNGAKGIGKNIFSENLCKALMGNNNHKMAHLGALETNFGALLKDCRMIVFDEVRVDTAEKINRLKRFVNEEQMLEFKGVDVDATTKTFNSFIISNNSKDDMRAISWDERRFAVPDLTKVKLRDVWSDTKIGRLIEVLSDLSEMRRFGYWIMYRKPTHSKFDDFKKNHFYDLCYNSFHEWQKVIIDLATSKTLSEITSTDLKREYRKRTEGTRLPAYSKIKDFIDNYRHRGEFSIGTLHKVGVEWTIALSEEFVGEENFLEYDEEDLLA